MGYFDGLLKVGWWCWCGEEWIVVEVCYVLGVGGIIIVGCVVFGVVVLRLVVEVE